MVTVVPTPSLRSWLAVNASNPATFDFWGQKWKRGVKNGWQVGLWCVRQGIGLGKKTLCNKALPHPGHVEYRVTLLDFGGPGRLANLWRVCARARARVCVCVCVCVCVSSILVEVVFDTERKHSHAYCVSSTVALALRNNEISISTHSNFPRKKPLRWFHHEPSAL